MDAGDQHWMTGAEMDDVAPAEVVLEELDRPQCLRLLAVATVGRIAVAVPDWSFPVIRPVNFVFDPPMNAVVFRSMRGSKLTALLLSGAAAFEVDEFDEIAKEGWSVVVAGQVEKIERSLDVDRAEGLGLDPWAPGDKPHWLCIRTEMVTGRRIRRHAILP
jgi:uncharacterized protein